MVDWCINQYLTVFYANNNFFYRSSLPKDTIAKRRSPTTPNISATM
ncbi:MAG: hypothetical protein F6K24_12170 [Okeania sp. SIO2D1]|nr:hypothetical protein [Okeania sp. SIO2D1]